VLVFVYSAFVPFAMLQDKIAILGLGLEFLVLALTLNVEYLGKVDCI